MGRQRRKTKDGTTAFGLAFGARLRELREAAGLSRPQLARLAGTKQERIYEHETGQRAPSLEAAQRYADALGVSLAEFDGLLTDQEKSEKE